MPYGCKICGEGFTSTTFLRRHVKTIHGKRKPKAGRRKTRKNEGPKLQALTPSDEGVKELEAALADLPERPLSPLPPSPPQDRQQTGSAIALEDPRYLSWPAPSDNSSTAVGKRLSEIRTMKKSNLAHKDRNYYVRTLDEDVRYRRITERATEPDGTTYSIVYEDFDLPNAPPD